MKNPKHYFRAMYLCQSVVYTVYMIISIMVYRYCGSYVASPVLGSAGPLVQKVAFGLALPGLLVSAMIQTHVSLPLPQ